MMGGTNTKYISDLSESSSSDEETDESTETEVKHIPNTSVDITTDAAFRGNVTLPKAQDVLNLAKVLEIEKLLEVEEIVSMVFLLFEDTQYALQELYLMLRGNSGKKLLHSWANVQEGRRSDWQNPFIEALCVIKNYEVLRSLGYRKDLSIAHFLPHNGLISLYLNEIKKASFIICEQLNSAKTKTLLDHVGKLFPQQNIGFGEYNLHFLELCFMNWEVMKTVTLFDIKKILKLMEEEHLCNLLEDVLSKLHVVNENEKSIHFKSLQYTENKVEPSTSAGYDSQSTRDAYFKSIYPSTSKSNRTRNASTTSVDNDYQQEYVQHNPFMDFHLPVGDITCNAEILNEHDNRYKVDPNKPGVVLIINQENFYTEIDPQYQKLLPPNTTEKLESRLGTKKDKEDLEKVFDKFGFKVLVANDLNHIDMLEKIKEVVNLVRDESSLFICILSHGDKGIVYGSNSCRVQVNKIKDIMYRTNKANLIDKPKILILQSCQGQQCQKIDDDEEEEYKDDNDTDFTTDGPSAPLRDMFTFWATLPGYAAIRNRKTGSWFIQALCKKMVEIENKHHFADICTRIKNEVTHLVWTKNETDRKAMTPYVQSTLLKDFYLPPLKP